MVKFLEKDECRHFISVHILDGTSPSYLLAQLKREFSSIQETPTIADQDEILFEICEDSCFGFSLNDLRYIAGRYAKVNVQCFSVDFDKARQRDNYNSSEYCL